MSGDAPEYLLAPGTSITLGARGTEVRLRRGNSEITVGAGWVRLLHEFGQARTLDDACRRSALHAAMRAQAEKVVTGLVERGFMELAGARSIRDLLAPGLLGEPVLAAIGKHLRDGRLVVIPNAFDPDFAESVHAALDGSDRWQAYEGTTEFFHYKHHNLYEPKEWPPALLACRDHLASRETLAFVQGLSGTDCAGPLQISASWYLPGDHSLPHNDDANSRSVAFVWHLSKRWTPAWGGALFWCPSGSYVAPSFNTLHLFNVSKSTVHFVTTVSPYATGKRLAVNGWWCRSTPLPVPAEPPAGATSVALSPPSGYGPPRERLIDPEVLVI